MRRAPPRRAPIAAGARGGGGPLGTPGKVRGGSRGALRGVSRQALRLAAGREMSGRPSPLRRTRNPVGSVSPARAAPGRRWRRRRRS